MLSGVEVIFRVTNSNIHDVSFMIEETAAGGKPPLSFTVMASQFQITARPDDAVRRIGVENGWFRIAEVSTCRTSRMIRRNKSGH